MTIDFLPIVLRDLRNERGWTQLDLSHYSGVGVKTLGHYEQQARTTVHLNHVEHVAQACGLRLSQLILRCDEAEAFTGIRR